MAKPNDTEKETWGTWEELLLACAVKRYGTKSWDSVAMEIQKRSSTLNLLTPQNCKHKYHDLKRRFMPKDHQSDDESATVNVDDGDDDNKTTDTISWLDELRKLRVAELKREVERYDLSIVSLQLKVKRLKEEREQSLRETEKGGGDSDPVKESSEEEKKEPEKLSPESVAGKSVSGEDSDRDNQSVNESNSTDPKIENLDTDIAEASGEKTVPVETAVGKPDPAGGSEKPAGSDSYNGSSDSIAKESAKAEAEAEGGAGDSPELLESVAESKGEGEEGTKESSDVQSSASLSRKEGPEKVVTGSSSGEEPENENQSPAIKSQPLLHFLEIIRSHKLGSVFERRLESQETAKYRNLIRQHIDLETVRMRHGEGWYSGCNARKFFRDMLLLFNNAIVFFGKKSSESTAAIELRQLVSKEMMAHVTPKSEPSPEEQAPAQPVPPPLKPDPEPSDSLLVKPKISGPMIACRKRSSLAAKASTSGVERKKEQTSTLIEEKPVLDWKQHDKSSVNAEEHRVTKKRTRERFTPGTRSATKNSQSRTNTNKNSEANSSQNTGGINGKGGSPNENAEPKTEKKNNTMTGAKRRSAANFLNRMKRSSSSNNGSLLETLKSSVISSDNNKGAEQKRNGGSRGDGRKDNVSRRGSGGKQAKEQGSPAKRSVGRPPKRAAAQPPPPPAVPAKRSREAGGADAVASRQPKKRSRK